MGKCLHKLNIILDGNENCYVSSWIIEPHCGEVSSHLKYNIFLLFMLNSSKIWQFLEYIGKD